MSFLIKIILVLYIFWLIFIIYKNGIRIYINDIMDHINKIMTIDNDIRIACVQLKRSINSVTFSV